MATTPNLNLPLIDENTVNDVPRDFNALAEAIDVAVGGVETEIEGLKQSGVDGKNRLETSIIAKKGTVSKQSQVATFAELDTGIRSIPTGTDTSDATAVAADILAPKIAYGPNGKIVGSMIRRSGEHAAVDYLYYPQNNNLYIKPPVGFYKGGTKGNWDSDANVYINEPKLNPANIPKDTTILGVLGVLERMTTAEKQAIVNAITGKGVAASVNDSNTVLAQKIGQIWTGPKYAKGSVVSSINTFRSFTSLTGTKQFEWIQVTGLNFRPNKIIIRRNQPSDADLSVYDWFTREAAPSTNVVFGSNYNYMMKYTGWYGLYVYEYTDANRPGSEAYVNDSGFLLPVTVGNAPYIWEAFKVQ